MECRSAMASSSAVHLPQLGARPLLRRACAPRRAPAARLPSVRASASARPPRVCVAAPLTPSDAAAMQQDAAFDASAAPPFGLTDLRESIPKHLWEKNAWKSVSYVLRDVAIVFGMAAGAAYLNNWLVWPLYWIAQGTMFWALFVVGHDCGHGSFSNNKTLNDFIGHLTHSSILVPYHGWRISHRTHHANHGHVENDESWHPLTKGMYDNMESSAKLGRLTLPWSMFAYPFYLVSNSKQALYGLRFWRHKLRISLPWAMFAYPFYLWKRSPGKEGSHFDPDCDLFTANERSDVQTSAAWWWGMMAVLGACTVALGPWAMFKLYMVPYWINVVWLDVVTYLHHHGYNEKVPWYRGEEWSYLRGGLSTIDRDYGIFNNIHHDIGTHVVHHLFPQIPHYNLCEATKSAKVVMGPYYRDPEPSPGPIPTHLFGVLTKSFAQDHFVADTGDVVFYEADPALNKAQ